MRVRTLVIIAIGLMAPSIAHAEWSFDQYLQNCRRKPDCDRDLALVVAFQAAASKTLNLTPRACLPPGIEDEPLLVALKDYMARHPERRSLPDKIFIREAAAEKWPCPPGPATFEELGCRNGVCDAVRPDGTIDPPP